MWCALNHKNKVSDLKCFSRAKYSFWKIIYTQQVFVQQWGMRRLSLSGRRWVFMWGLSELKAQTGTYSAPVYGPGFMLVPKGRTILPPLAIPNRTHYKIRGMKVCYLLLVSLLHNLIRHKPNGWAAIKMVFTPLSYMLVTQYSALLEFKTWSGPMGRARPVYSCSVAQGTVRISHRGGTCICNSLMFNLSYIDVNIWVRKKSRKLAEGERIWYENKKMWPFLAALAAFMLHQMISLSRLGLFWTVTPACGKLYKISYCWIPVSKEFSNQLRKLRQPCQKYRTFRRDWRVCVCQKAVLTRWKHKTA